MLFALEPHQTLTRSLAIVKWTQLHGAGMLHAVHVEHRLWEACRQLQVTMRASLVLMLLHMQ